MNREDKIKLAIEKGITCDLETGKVYGVKGGEVTYKDKHGYIIIRITHKSKQYSIKSHHFVWYCAYNKIVDEMDHKNGQESDNRLSNLRPSNRFLNNHNKKSSNGFHFCNRLKKYVSKICIKGKSIYLGSYHNEKDARQAYLNAKDKYIQY
jgi:signal peptidase I